MTILYDELLKEVPVTIDEFASLPKSFKGLYVEALSNKAILLSRNISRRTERACILAEELGHYHTTVGNILDQRKLTHRKQEKRARQWAYERLVPLSKIVQAHKLRIPNRYEFAEFLGVTEEFFTASLKRYREKYGLFTEFDGYTICFEPLGVIEMFDD